MWIALLAFGVSFGQTVLISNVGNGGFENGTTPAANGWTAVNSATDGWYVGAAPVVSNGTNCGFISSTAGTDWTYSQVSVTQHIYYDVTIPAGESKLALTFKWKVGGEGTTTSDWDNMKVFFGTVTNIGTPVANTAISATYQISGPGAVSGMYKLSSAAWNTETINLIGIPGETYRLVFSWKSDVSYIANPPAAIDDVLLLSTAPDPLHGLYTINNLAPTSAPMVHDGTGNFASFTAAINHMNSEGVSGPVMFAVVAGQTFAEDCPVINATGTSTNTITFTRAGAGANPVVTPTGTTGTTDAGFTINGGDYFTFNGIDVMIASGSAMEYGYYIKNASALDGAQYNTIANSKITLNRANTSSRGISVYNATTPTNVSGSNSYITIHKNTIENCYYGMQLTGNSGYPLESCVIDSNIVGAATPNDIGGGSSATSGIRASYTSGVTIFANLVRNVYSTDIAHGIFFENGVGANNNIGNNVVYTISTSSTTATKYVYGIRAEANSGCVANVFNNMVSDLSHGLTTASATISIRALAVGVSGGTGTVNLVHNSVYFTEDAVPSSAALFVNAGTVNIANNVLFNNSPDGATSKRYAIYRNGGTLNSDYNDLYVVAGTNNFIGYNGTDQATLANWQAATTMDTHSISIDPTFTSLTDLHTTNAALNGSGMAIAAVTEDIDGDARDAMFPDMGADENLLPPTFSCVLPTPGNTIASSTALCYGDGVLLTLQNATAGTGVAYQWQGSTDGVTYTNITGATSFTYATIPTVPTYFQCVVTCYNGPVSGTSTPVLVGFAHEITSSTGASRCGTGTLTLSATGSAGSDVVWYDAQVGGTALDTATSFVTPVISSTTSYYVAAEATNFIPGVGTIGTGTSTSTSSGYTPLYTYYETSKNQILFLASELQASGLVAGNISAMAFNISSVSTTAMTNFEIQMGHTTLSALTTTYETGLTSVYTNAAYTPAGTGWQTITFTTPFNWDGVSNIIIQICDGNNASYSTSNGVYYSTTAFSSHHYGYMDGGTGCAVTAPTNNYVGSYRPNVRFTGLVSQLCAGPRVEVVATIGASPALTLTADQTVCNNSAAQIDVTSTLTDYDSYVWTPETDLYTDAACTTPYTTGASATTVYLKSTTEGAHQIICSANNSGSGCADLDTTIVTVLPGAPVAAASPETICGSGSAAITITPATGWDIATFQWMESTDNATFSDIVGANAISYTTPVITDTMYYKMVVELGAAVCTESNVVTILVKNPQVLSTTPASRCGNGTVTLSATSNSGTDLNWYDAITGGNLLGSGLSFVTPAISSTTSYYVEASYTAPLITAEIGTGTTTGTSATYSPLYTTYESSKQQLLYTASELQSAGLVAGNINSLAFHVSSVSSMAMTNFNVSIGTTALAALTTTFETGLTNVYTSAAYTPADTGWQTILFSTPYAWDGVSNIIIEVCDGNNSGYATGSGVYYTVTPFVSHHYAYDDGVQGCSTTTFDNDYTSSNRANIRFTADNSCTSARTEVVATVTTPPAITVTATPAIICLNETTDLEATSSNTGYSYVWEPGTLSGATQTVTPTGTTTYNVTASDNSGGANDGCVATGSVLVTVNPIPTNVAITASDASLCTGESLQLSASATSETDVILNYTEGFEAWPPVDWTFINNGAGNSWTSYGSAYAGSSSMAYSYDENYAADAWAITPSMNMVSGTSYTISFWYKVYSASYPEDLKITVGSVPSVAGQTTVLWDNGGDTALINTTYSQATITYTPTTSGSYYFGFNCYSEANMWRLYVDSVSISGTTLNPCTYTWTSVPAGFASTDQTPAAFIPTATAQYIVVAENNLGCSASADTTISVNPIPVVNLGSDQAICDTTTITLDAGNAGSTYDWSTGGTAQTEDILGSDLGVGANTVTVDVTSAAGCTGTGSVVITVTVCSGIEDPSMQISYYPNPATNMLNLDLSELPTGDYRFELLNMQGQKVMDKILVNDGNVISVNLMDIAPGSYVISVSGNNNTFRNYLSIQE